MDAAAQVLFERSDYAIANPGGTLLGPNDFRDDARAALEAAAAIHDVADAQAKTTSLREEPRTAAKQPTVRDVALAFDRQFGRPTRKIVVAHAGEDDLRLFVYGETARDLYGLPDTYQGCEVFAQIIGRVRPLTHVADAMHDMPAARRDLDRMGEAIKTLSGSPVVGRAIGDGR